MESSLQHEQHVSGNFGLHFDHLWMGAGFFHPADGLLEGLFTGWNGHHHGNVLVQSMEDVCHWFNGSVQLQGLSLDAGTGWSAIFLFSSDYLWLHLYNFKTRLFHVMRGRKNFLLSCSILPHHPVASTWLILSVILSCKNYVKGDCLFGPMEPNASLQRNNSFTSKYVNV